MSKKDSLLDFAKFSSRVESSSAEGRTYWRTLDELSGDEKFEALLKNEFPYMAGDDGKVQESSVDRRQFLKFMGASLAFAGLTACRRPAEAIVPYVNKPEDLVPGKPLFFATAMSHAGGAIGLLVESHEGRPTKIDGNPLHPASLGASDAFAQASVLNLYDPDRSQTVRNVGEISTWENFVTAASARLAADGADGGARVRILTESITSPTLARQMQELMAKMPNARLHQWEPANRDNANEGAKLAFGSYVNTVYQFNNADVVVSLGSDILSEGAGHLRYAKEFTARRRVRKNKTTTTRLYAIESFPSNTGSVADHRFRVKPSEMLEVAKALAGAVGVGGVNGSATQNWIATVAKDLQASRGRSIVVAGDEQPPVVHAIAHAMNAALGNIGTTVQVTEPVEFIPVNNGASLKQLASEMHAGSVGTLLILGGNPVFNAPVDYAFASALEKVPFKAHLSSHYDETSAMCQWHIPEAHFLESWSDARAFDGTASIVQPLIAPLFNGRSAHEVIAVLMGAPKKPYELVKETWAANAAGADPETFWNKALHDGVIPGTAFQPRSSAANAGGVAAALAAIQPLPASGGYELVIKADPTIYDGRFANNGWLQELPKPVTKITWDNVAHVSPATAKKLGITDEDLIEIKYRGRAVRMAAWRTPGHADDTITIHYGYGRRRSGKLANGAGVDVYQLRMSDGMHFVSGAEVSVVGEKYPVAGTQHHFSQDTGTAPGKGRELVRAGTIAEFVANPEFVKQESDYDRKMNILHGWEYKSYAWGMSIDTSACLGCGGCVVACQAENNIPVIGKKEVRRGREMHWLRIDRYYEGSPENPITYHQPMMCQHCENAPCEPVCPVEATTHSPEGINEMTYNRCIGTRYCSNNCPYKVRRFNFFAYADFNTPTLKLQRNPDVTTRSRGVMEKCTFCVQRVNEARIEAEKENRKIRDGEVVTACQAACPTEAIIFGDINDPNSKVAQLKAEPHNYKVLGEINTNPRSTYLATIRNPNPEIEALRG